MNSYAKDNKTHNQFLVCLYNDAIPSTGQHQQQSKTERSLNLDAPSIDPQKCLKLY
jgi:hypothetical protein